MHKEEEQEEDLVYFIFLFHRRSYGWASSADKADYLVGFQSAGFQPTVS